MKNKLQYIAISALFLLPFVAPWEGDLTSQWGNATEGIAFDQPAVAAASATFLPVFDWDMSGLDARDAQNRPIQDAAATQALTELFRNTLFSMTVVANLHSIEQIWSDLELFSRLFHGLMFNAAYAVIQTLPKGWLPSSKRFVHNVHNLWIPLAVGGFFCCLLISLLFIKPAHQHVILRC